jgi:hypothetical protein
MGKIRVIPAGDVVIQSQLSLGQLTGVAVLGEGGILCGADLTEGRVLDGAAPRPVLIGGSAGAASRSILKGQVVRENPM